MAGCGSTWRARWLTRSAPIRWPASTTASRVCASSCSCPHSRSHPPRNTWTGIGRRSLRPKWYRPRRDGTRRLSAPDRGRQSVTEGFRRVRCRARPDLGDPACCPCCCGGVEDIRDSGCRSGGAEVVGEPDSGHSEEVPALGSAVPGRLAVLQGLAGQAGEGELGMDLDNAVVGMANPSVDLPDLVPQGKGLLRNALPGAAPVLS